MILIYFFIVLCNYFLVQFTDINFEMLLLITFYILSIIHIASNINLLKLSKVILILLISCSILLLIIDLFYRDYVSLIGSGADSELFYKLAVLGSQGEISLLTLKYERLYVSLLSFVFYFAQSRLLLQLMNTVFLYYVFIFLEKTLKIMDVEKRTYYISAFNVVLIINSAILLREMPIILLTTISIYKYIKNQEKVIYSLTISLLYLLPAIIMHSGVIAIYMGMLLTSFIDYNMNKKNILLTAIIMVIVVYPLISRIGLSKFDSIKNFDDVIYKSTHGIGNSTYLTSVEINSLFQFILFVPIKIVYFLLSPLPHNWRNKQDAVAFLIDSTLYIFVFFYVAKYGLRKNNKYLSFLYRICFIFLLIFGIGLNNAGTAMRHRNKLYPVLFLIVNIIYDQKKCLKT